MLKNLLSQKLRLGSQFIRDVLDQQRCQDLQSYHQGSSRSILQWSPSDKLTSTMPSWEN